MKLKAISLIVTVFFTITSQSLTAAVENRAEAGFFKLETKQTEYKTVEVDSLKIFYREAGEASKPTIVLLHGFPSSSHMYRDLINDLADRYHVIAPDYPGFGQSSSPSTKQYTYTFDNLSVTIEHFINKLNIKKTVFYLQDYGGPIGMRIAARRPELVQGLIIQNANAYTEGLGETLKPLVAYIENPNAENEKAARFFLTLDATKWQYLTGAENSSVGANSLLGNVSGNRNSALGYQANVLSGALNYASAIGADSRVGTSDTVVLGALGVNKNSTYSTIDDQIVIGSTARNDTFLNTKLYVEGNVNLNGDLYAANATFSGAVNFQGGVLVPTDQKLRFGGGGGLLQQRRESDMAHLNAAMGGVDAHQRQGAHGLAGGGIDHRKVARVGALRGRFGMAAVLVFAGEGADEQVGPVAAVGCGLVGSKQVCGMAGGVQWLQLAKPALQRDAGGGGPGAPVGHGLADGLAVFVGALGHGG